MNNNFISTGINFTGNHNRKELHQLFDQVFSKFLCNEVFLSFNGGKDCTVLLDALCNYFELKQKPKFPLLIVYIQPENSFEEVENFITNCESLYQVNIEKKRGNLKEALNQICKKEPKLKAVIMGCRRTDPYCSDLKTIQMTDPGWPSLLRINPLLDWSSKDVWNYILKNGTRYCSLYDEGYSSLGDKTNTHRNPNLLRHDPEKGTPSYVPAAELTDDKQERVGRL